MVELEGKLLEHCEGQTCLGVAVCLWWAYCCLHALCLRAECTANISFHSVLVSIVQYIAGMPAAATLKSSIVAGESLH